MQSLHFPQNPQDPTRPSESRHRNARPATDGFPARLFTRKTILGIPAQATKGKQPSKRAKGWQSLVKMQTTCAHCEGHEGGS